MLKNQNFNLDNSSSRNLFHYFKIDLWLTALLALLILLSFGMLFSAANQKVGILIRHGANVGLGVVIFLILSHLPVRFTKLMAPILYVLGLFLLTFVLLKGSSSKGAQRWINLGIMRFQPSEFMKLVVPLTLAFYLSDKNLPLEKKPVFISLLLIFIPAALIAKQPDLGTAILVTVTGFGVLFFAGIKWRWIINMLILVLAGLPVLWWRLHGYQRERVLTFLNPERDPLGSGYHIIQSKIAIGSGGVFGKGWTHGTQSQLNFLPERTTDFIFSVFGEEFGFIGACVLCALYFGIMLRGLIIMAQSHASFNRLAASGITFGFFMCFFINIGMVSGLLPVVGCPLPILSYGGTSLVTWMAAFGILVAIHAAKQSR